MDNYSAADSNNLFLFYLENKKNLIDVYPAFPEGWVLDSETHWLYKDGIIRGSIFLKSITPPHAIFELDRIRRYNVDCFVGTGQVCVLDYDKTIIKEIGKVENAWSEECERLIEQGYKWLDENYPEWKDPTKYWND